MFICFFVGVGGGGVGLVFARYMFEVFDIADKLNYITNNNINRKIIVPYLFIFKFLYLQMYMFSYINQIWLVLLKTTTTLFYFYFLYYISITSLGMRSIFRIKKKISLYLEIPCLWRHINVISILLY